MNKKNNPMSGSHALLSAYKVANHEFLTNEKSLDKIKEFVIDTGLTVVGQSSYAFENGGWTGTLVLLESHVCIHTWPECKGFTMDIFVCNYTKNNQAKAKVVVDQVIRWAKVLDPRLQWVLRGGTDET